MLLLIFSQQNIPFNQGDDERLIVEQLFLHQVAIYGLVALVKQIFVIICINSILN